MKTPARMLTILAVGMGALVNQAQAREEQTEGAGARKLTASELVELRDADGLALSPDGAHVAFQIRQAHLDTDDYSTSWFVADLESRGRATALGDGGEPMFMMTSRGIPNGNFLTEEPQWSPDSEWIAYRAQLDGEVQLWRAHRTGRIREQLSHNPADVKHVAWSPDGAAIFFQTGRSRVEIEGRLEAEGARGFLYDDRYFPWESDRPQRAKGLFEPEPEPLELWIYDLRSRTERRPTASEEALFYSLEQPVAVLDRPAVRSAVAGQEEGTAWLEARDPKQQGVRPPLTLVVREKEGIAPAVCEAAECTGSLRSLWWRNAHEVVFARSEGVQGERTGIYAWQPGSRTVRTILKTRDFLGDCQLETEHLVCFHETAIQPGQVVTVDLDTGSINTLYDPNPSFSALSFGPVSTLVWSTPSGIETVGYLVLPPGHQPLKPLPLVITTYRFRGFLRGGVGDEYPVHLLAAAGFAVLCFNKPTFPGLEATAENWQDYSRALRGDDSQKRIVQASLDAAVSLLAERGIVDPDRVGLSGLSFGAETTHYALFNMPHLSAAIASGPSLDPIIYYLSGHIVNEMRRDLYGVGAPDGPSAARWRKLSLSANVERVHAPLLINSADSEYLLTLQSVTALQEHGKPVELHIFPDEYHIKWRPAHRLAIYERNVDWFRFWLQDYEGPDPAKAEQYARWRKLRQQHAVNLAMSADLSRQSR